MSRLVIATCSPAFIGSLSGQDGRRSLTGTVTDPHGATVAATLVQLVNKTTGAFARTSSQPDGHYVLAGLAAGTYELSIVMPCCVYNRVARGVVLEAGKSVELNIRLTETVNGTTLGDDPGRLADAMQKRAKVQSRPVPRGAGGKPDLSGVWIATVDPYPETPEALPWAAALIQESKRTMGKTRLTTAVFRVHRLCRGARRLLSRSLCRPARPS